jgi:competence/damage-inducible protein CinA-like protein
MPSAEIITIGTEILLGEIVDTNARYIARQLRDIGVDLFRTSTVGDNQLRIVSAIQEAMSRCNILITTGGLGPTVDDPTREAVAKAIGVQTEFRPELWEQILARFQRYNRTPTENNRRQAYIPQGAQALENPVGTAPCFIVESGENSIICLPGVPREMEYVLDHSVLPYLRQRYQLSGIIKTRVLHTVGVGESLIDDLIGDLEELSNPTVGLAAHSGQVDIRITAKADSEAMADTLNAQVEKDLRKRLGKWIYGADTQTLESTALKILENKGWSLIVIESGLGGNLVQRLAIVGHPFRTGEVIVDRPSLDQLAELVEDCRQRNDAEVGLGVVIYPAEEKQDVHLILITPQGRQDEYRPYGGPPDYATRYAIHHSLDLIRQL